jgi:hypothetical protein
MPKPSLGQERHKPNLAFQLEYDDGIARIPEIMPKDWALKNRPNPKNFGSNTLQFAVPEASFSDTSTSA